MSTITQEMVKELNPESFTTQSSTKLSSAPVDLPPYQIPSTGILSFLPASLVPFAELMRVHKPAGYYAFYFPHLFGALYASALLNPLPTPTSLLWINLIFLSGSLLLRGAACTWNDTLDAPFDRQVARCRNRPVARGAVSPATAHLFTAAQALVGASLLACLPPTCQLPALLLTTTMAIYPFCKRVTHYPQLVLGLSLALGQLVGAAGTGLDVLALRDLPTVAGLAALYAANVVNAVVYDAVYAHQDLQDDLKAGVMSVAVAWQGNTKPILAVLATVEVVMLAAAGYLLRFGAAYQAVAAGGTAVVLATMIGTVRLDVPADCWKWFTWSIWLTGGTLSTGLALEYVERLYGLPVFFFRLSEWV